MEVHDIIVECARLSLDFASEDKSSVSRANEHGAKCSFMFIIKILIAAVYKLLQS